MSVFVVQTIFVVGVAFTLLLIVTIARALVALVGDLLGRRPDR